MVDRPTPAQVRSDNFEEALENGMRMLDRDPSAALKQAESLVRLRNDARVFRLAAAACRKLGLKADAEGAELGAIQASLNEPVLKRAAELMADEMATEARESADEYLVASPDDLLAKTIAAEASLALWDLDHAERLLRSVVDRAPTFLRAVMLLARCLAMQVRMRDGIAVLDEFLKRKPDNVTALASVAHCRSEVNDNEQTAAIFERLVALDDTRPERWSQLGHHYRILGRREDAIRAFRHAIALDPSSGAAWWSFANYFPGELDDRDEAAIREGLAEKSGSPDEGALHLALGILADRAGNHAMAAGHFITGKKIRLEHQPYEPGPISTAIDGVIDQFRPEFYERRCRSGWPDATPIFIIGMPRSGTTMVERILGRHSRIEGAGEMHIMPKLAELARHQADNPEHYAGLLDSLTADQLANVGRHYVAASRDYRRSNKPLFIDKNNLNWMQVGLILLSLPNARILDVRRNALDCCWANFKMLFAERFPATNDLRHVGQFYRDYVRLFDAMAAAAPGRILSVRYEDVVDDLEGQTRRMLEFLGVGFEPECLDFHLSTGAVATASSEQVRQPLNRKGIGSAEPYRQWLGPLIEELGPLAG